MARGAAVSAMTPDEAIAVVRDWWAHAPRCRGVEFREPVPVPPGPGDNDYNVIYEAVFEPPELTKARVELWVTDEGGVAVLFETKARLASRLSKRRIYHGRRCLGGHEPCPVSAGVLRGILEAVSKGEVSVTYTEVLGALFGIRCVMQPQDRERLVAAGYIEAAFWLRTKSVAGIAKKAGLRRSVVYDPWSP